VAQAEEHIAELLKLSVDERARAARLLLDSLDDTDVDPDAEQKRLDELVRRAHAVRDGTAELVDGDEARRRVIARLRDIRGE
jgi:hypothetical protein